MRKGSFVFRWTLTYHQNLHDQLQKYNFLWFCKWHCIRLLHTAPVIYLLEKLICILHTFELFYVSVIWKRESDNEILIKLAALCSILKVAGIHFWRRVFAPFSFLIFSLNHSTSTFDCIMNFCYFYILITNFT